MPFIACLNNVTNTHASTQTQKTKPAHTHNHGHEPASHTTLSTRPVKERPAASARTSRPNSIKIALHNNTPLEGMHRRKMLASTMQISNNNPTNPLSHPRRPRTKRGTTKHHTPHPPPHPPTDAHPQRVHTHKECPGEVFGLILQDPTVCLTPSPTNVRQQVLRPQDPAR